MKRLSDYFMLFLLIGIILTFYAIFIVGQTDASDMENRELAKLKTFEMKEFIEKTFQNNLENAISDQIIGAKPIKKKALEVRKDIVGLIDSAILTVRNNPTGKYYVAVSEDLYRMNKEEFLIFQEKNNLYNEKSIDYFNTIKGADKYLYFIERDRSKNYNNVYENQNEIYETIAKKIEVTKSSKFSVPSFEEYKKYFYQTDHHWNAKGSYQGYKEIADLLGIPRARTGESYRRKTI